MSEVGDDIPVDRSFQNYILVADILVVFRTI